MAASDTQVDWPDDAWDRLVAGPAQRDVYRQALAARFAEAADEKNGTLVRADIIESLRRVYDVTSDETIHDTAEELIATEQDDKYRRKYTKIWRSDAGR